MSHAVPFPPQIVGIMEFLKKTDGSEWANVMKAPGFDMPVGPGRVPTDILQPAHAAQVVQVGAAHRLHANCAVANRPNCANCMQWKDSHPCQFMCT